MPTVVKLLHKRHTLSVTKRKLGYKHTTTVVAGQSSLPSADQQLASQPNTKEGLTSNHGLGESVTRCSKTSKIYCLRRGTSYSALPSPWVLLQGLYQPPTEVVADHLKCAFRPIKPRLLLASHQLMWMCIGISLCCVDVSPDHVQGLHNLWKQEYNKYPTETSKS